MVVSRRQWIACQIGAREHFAIPRALWRRDLLDGVVTDYWARPRSLAGWVRQRFAHSLSGRFHSDLDSAKICSFNNEMLALELASRCRGQTGWDLIAKRNGWFQTRAAQSVVRLVEQRRSKEPPVVFAFSYSAKKIFETAKQFNCPTVLGQIDPGPFETRIVQKVHKRHGLVDPAVPPQRYWDQWRMECNLADLIVVNSTWSQLALEYEGISSKKIVVVPLAYEIPDDVRPAIAPVPDCFSHERPLEVLFLGQVIARKGVVELVDAAKQMTGRPVRWTIVGGGDPVLLKRLSEVTDFRVVGQVDRQSAVTYYQNADVFILPTHSDGFAITLLEAAAFGLPIIASKFCGDVVREGVNGWTLRDVSAGSIAGCIQAVLESPEQLREFRLHLTQQQSRSIDDLADDLVQLTDQLISKAVH